MVIDQPSNSAGSCAWRVTRACGFTLIAFTAVLGVSCRQPERQAKPGESATITASQPGYDTMRPKPVAPRDRREREVARRADGLRRVDRLMDPKTPLPPFDRHPLPPLPSDSGISDDVEFLDDQDPFAEVPPLALKESTIDVGISRTTYRTREPEEVLSAVQPFIDLVQREVNIRGTAHIHETADSLFYDMLDGRNQMAACNVFEYLLIRDWFALKESNGTILLATAKSARPRITDVDRELPGTPGSSIEIIVARDSAYKGPADLKGTRLAMPANIVPAPGAFLTRLFTDLGHPRHIPFFGQVTLRRYSKDAVIDVLKGKADAACVDQGTVAALCRFYGLEKRIRTVAVSPRYNVDVLFTSQNNLETRREEIELTQRQLTTLGKDPEGQEVLFFFDVEGWSNYRDDEIAVPRAHYEDYLKFLEETPVDLLPLLDPRAPVDRRTYDRLGDE